MTTMDLRVTKVLGLGMLAAAFFRPVSAAADTAASEANPYAVISDRNIFHLNPPPPPPSADDKPVDVPKVMLSGFRTVAGHTRVFLVLQPKDPKDPKEPKEVMKFLDLAQGEKVDPVEVVKIDSEKRQVDIVNTGHPMTLTFADNGVAVAAAAPAPGGRGPGGPPGMPGGRRPGLPSIPASIPPPQGGTAPPAAPSGSSAIIIGGNNEGSGPVISGGSSGGYNNSGGAIVTGGSSTPAVATPAAATGTSLLNPATSYRMPAPVAPVPLPVQAAVLAATHAAGGPPAPPMEDQ